MSPKAQVSYVPLPVLVSVSDVYKVTLGTTASQEQGAKKGLTVFSCMS